MNLSLLANEFRSNEANYKGGANSKGNGGVISIVVDSLNLTATGGIYSNA